MTKQFDPEQDLDGQSPEWKRAVAANAEASGALEGVPATPPEVAELHQQFADGQLSHAELGERLRNWMDTNR